MRVMDKHFQNEGASNGSGRSRPLGQALPLTLTRTLALGHLYISNESWIQPPLLDEDLAEKSLISSGELDSFLKKVVAAELCNAYTL